MSGWIMSVFFAALICTAAEIIIPENNRKIVNIVLGVFFLAVFISPLKNLNFDFDTQNVFSNTSFDSTSSFSDFTNEQYMSVCEDKIKQLVINGTDTVELNKENISVNINKDENGVIKAESVIIQLDKRLYSIRNRIKKEVSENTGLEVYFTMKDDENESLEQ